MRTVKIVILSLFTLLFIRVSGQTVQKVLFLTIADYDYSGISPVIGIVSGTLEYHITYKLSKQGFIESIHWNVKNCDLHNSEGVEIKALDTGNDNSGFLWDFFNTPNASNDEINLVSVSMCQMADWMHKCQDSCPRKEFMLKIYSLLNVRDL